LRGTDDETFTSYSAEVEAEVSRIECSGPAAAIFTSGTPLLSPQRAQLPHCPFPGPGRRRSSTFLRALRGGLRSRPDQKCTLFPVKSEGYESCGYPTLRLRTFRKRAPKKRGARSRRLSRATNPIPVISFMGNAWPGGQARSGGRGPSAGVRVTAKNRNWIRDGPAARNQILGNPAVAAHAARFDGPLARGTNFRITLRSELNSRKVCGISPLLRRPPGSFAGIRLPAKQGGYGPSAPSSRRPDCRPAVLQRQGRRRPVRP
jgi:hypothetical protein